ncbi:MAG TPA: FmdB family zinc ribbon protein [Acidimicrobiales bacterium]|nr:FmdB family zinc ribbon protein [Acidimicrobiales bacterium]
MPTYEYACKSCGEHLEIVQSFKDDPLTTCPTCSGELRKVFGSIGIAFKGSGFYKTDSRRPAKSEKSESSSSSTSKSETKTESKSETKSTPSEPKSSAATA